MDRDDDVDDDVSLLVVVLETNSQFWFPRSRKQQETTTTTPSTSLYAFEKVCKDIAAFSSAYLACNRANRIAVVAAHARKECTFLFRSHLEGDVVLEDEEDKEDKEGDNTKKRKKKKRKKPPTNPRMTFVGDDECDDIGGFANDAQDVDALDISKGLEPLQTTFRRAFFDGLKALSDENVVNYDDDDDDENREQQHATPRFRGGAVGTVRDEDSSPSLTAPEQTWSRSASSAASFAASSAAILAYKDAPSSE